jgi:uncharacterized integral membrane protein
MTTEPQATPTPGVAPLPQPTTGSVAPPSGSDSPASPPQAGPQHAALPQSHHKIKRTRISGLWVAVGCFAVVLLLLLIFILQNGTKVDISYIGAHGHLPLGVALLLSAVGQLRAVARRHRRADAQRVAAAKAPGNPAGSAS